MQEFNKSCQLTQHGKNHACDKCFNASFFEVTLTDQSVILGNQSNTVSSL